MYKKIKIENFRGMANLELNDPQQFNLFVGKNNCGKTSLLESIFLLTGPTNVDLPVRINFFRGYHLSGEYSWELLFNKMETHSPIRLYGDIPQLKEERWLTIKPLKEESFSKVDPHVPLFSIEDSQVSRANRTNGLSMELKIQGSEKKKPQTFLSEIRVTGENTGKNSPKSFPSSFPGIFLTPRTINPDEARRFNEVQIRKQEKSILKILQKVEPQLADLSIGADNILYCDMGFPKRLPLNVAGEGLKNLLSTILAIYNASGGVVLIDEIENGFHYLTQEILWEAIFEAAITFDVQVFATTHSYENVQAYSAAYEKLKDKDDLLRLFRMEKELDTIKLVDFNHEMLKAAIESYWEVR